MYTDFYVCLSICGAKLFAFMKTLTHFQHYYVVLYDYLCIYSLIYMVLSDNLKFKQTWLTIITKGKEKRKRNELNVMKIISFHFIF